jgi:hypothetical protein
MSSSRSSRDVKWGRRVRIALIVASAALAWPVIAQTLPPDLCGCRDHVSLGDFDTRVASTWPAGTTFTNSINGGLLTIPLPADGVVVFDSMHLEWVFPLLGNSGVVEVTFQHNAANTPVTILVKGDVLIANNAALQVRGANGGNGTQDTFGAGGLGGHGGFRGGDGAFRLANLVTDGGVALGPGGGIGATASPQTAAGQGTFIGAVDLLPLVGGSGGGGGRSTNAISACAGGGGGGGGGALLLAANGTITVNNFNGSIFADGGIGSSSNGSPCASSGAGGSGGAIRVIANTIAGSGRILARGGRRNDDNLLASGGAIRLEAISNTLGVTLTDPVASRSQTPGPLVNPFTPSVTVTAVAGQAVPAPPQGVFGAVDIQLPVPGPAAIDLATDGVPVGTTVEVKAKPRVGGPPITQNVTLTNCDGTGRCLASLTIDLAAGIYAVEARATFQAGQ